MPDWKSSDESGEQVGAILKSGAGLAQGHTFPVLEIPNGGRLCRASRVAAPRQFFTF
jgi:hypothetical protein